MAASTGVVVVLTALDSEYAAVRALLRDLQRRMHRSGTIFEVGSLDGQPGAVALAGIGVGNQVAAVIAERAITEFRPRAVLFVGVAGALHPDLELGTVVVATKVYGYHGATADASGSRAQPQAWPADHTLEQLAREVKRTGMWHRLLPTPPDVQFRPVAAGEVVLNSRETPLADQLHNHYADAAAIEMESAGMATAAHYNRAPFLTVRAISDKADGTKHSTDQSGWQLKAATNAAAFAIAVARSLLTSSKPTQPTPPDQARATATPNTPSWAEPIPDGMTQRSLKDYIADVDKACEFVPPKVDEIENIMGSKNPWSAADRRSMLPVFQDLHELLTEASERILAIEPPSNVADRQRVDEWCKKYLKLRDTIGGAVFEMRKEMETRNPVKYIMSRVPADVGLYLAGTMWKDVRRTRQMLGITNCLP